MKVLLAPLFFRSRFCRRCARIFYKENPSRWLGLHEFETLPPLGSFDKTRGFIPDYPTLLMFEECALDGGAFERLKNPGARTWLNEWSELVTALKSEGALNVVDVTSAVKSRARERATMLRRDLCRPQRWWQAMAYYNALTGNAERLLGDSPAKAQNLSWEFNPKASFGVPGSDGLKHDIAFVLHEAGESENIAHRELFTRALATLRSQLQEINACLTACDELGTSPILWGPYGRYLREKLNGSTPTMESLSRSAAATEFFRIAFPAYSPTTIKVFTRMRNDKRINALRNEISRASSAGELLDPKYPQRVLTEVLQLERRSARMREIAGWIATAVGVVPLPGLGLAATAAAEAITRTLEHRARRPWHWFYLISDGRGAT